MKENTDNKERRKWRKEWLYLLFEFTHRDFQKNLWIKQLFHDKYGWFSEDTYQYIEELLEDGDYDVALEMNYISKQEYKVIEAFHKQLKNYIRKNKYKDEEEVLRDDYWENLMMDGEDAWEELKELIIGKEDREFIIDLETKYM